MLGFTCNTEWTGYELEPEQCAFDDEHCPIVLKMNAYLETV